MGCSIRPVAAKSLGERDGVVLPEYHIVTCTEWFMSRNKKIRSLTRTSIVKKTQGQISHGDLKGDVLDDCLQCAFEITLRKHKEPFETPAKFQAWIATVAANAFITDYRKSRRRETVSLDNLRTKHHNQATQSVLEPEDYRTLGHEKTIQEAAYWKLVFEGISQFQSELFGEDLQLFREAYLQNPPERKDAIAERHGLKPPQLSKRLATIRSRLDKILISLGVDWKAACCLRQSSIFELARGRQIKKQGQLVEGGQS